MPLFEVPGNVGEFDEDWRVAVLCGVTLNLQIDILWDGGERVKKVKLQGHDGTIYA